jgi:HPt (histidine-containing phosphotransfer) domain-containing protein
LKIRPIEWQEEFAVTNLPDNGQSSDDAGIVASKLHQLAQDTDPLFVHDLGLEFLNSAPCLLQEIQTALSAGNHRRAGMLAHSLKANAATFGLAGLAQNLKDLEMACKAEQPQETVRIYDATLRAYPVSAQSLERQLSEMPCGG